MTKENNIDDFFDNADYDVDSGGDNDGVAASHETASASTGAAAGGSAGAAAGTFPYRGLAMILIAVAVALGLWALYALTQGGGAENNAASGQSNSTATADKNPGAAAGNGAAQPGTNQDPNAPAQPGQPGAHNTNGAPGAEGASHTAPEGAAAHGARDGNATNGASESNQDAGAAAAPKADVVNVYNNSTITGLAANVSQSLRADGVDVGVESGNIPESQMVLAETTVFFDPAVEGAEDKARELADRVGGVARANVDTLPQEATEGGALTLVLTRQVNL
ncbi:LytR C-terminal domain-containing protein [Corynebacterium cystitidis]|uniref:LytR C-terminal domain-containing protein n=1 Tax=Corynebacterium cystitidis TaxID=35757 RepID=UPI00115F8254|nr:LytR C-terminal domain-containing protein [Corynebacterium cystitidis]